jgi:hypothetical protein
MQAWMDCRSLTAWAVVCACLALGACDVQSYDEAASAFENNGGEPPVPPDDNPDVTFGPRFSEIQASVLTPDCATSSCHSGANPSAGLNLEASQSYTNLVGIASSQQPGLQRVEQGDPANSYLIHKLSGSATTGEVMPPAGGLSAPAIAVVRQWIADGALDDRSQPSVPIRVTSLVPAPNASLFAPPTQIVAGFDRTLDTSTVNAMTFTVRGSGGDASFTDGNEVQVTASSIFVPGANPSGAVFDLAGVTLADDTYRVSLAGAGASLIMDLDANALDGEYSGTFPSGNGVAGGNFTVQFSVATAPPTGPTLDEIQAAIFTPRCASCHSGPAGVALPAGLDLSDADASFQSLVGVSSIQAAALLRVAPNDPDASYLVHKIEGNAGTGSIMPPSGILPIAMINQVRQWIADGAVR